MAEAYGRGFSRPYTIFNVEDVIRMSHTPQEYRELQKKGQVHARAIKALKAADVKGAPHVPHHPSNSMCCISMPETWLLEVHLRLCGLAPAANDTAALAPEAHDMQSWQSRRPWTPFFTAEAVCNARNDVLHRELAHSVGAVTAKEVESARARELSLLQDVECALCADNWQPPVLPNSLNAAIRPRWRSSCRPSTQ